MRGIFGVNKEFFSFSKDKIRIGVVLCKCCFEISCWRRYLGVSELKLLLVK
jgi:hypothetical protein